MSELKDRLLRKKIPQSLTGAYVDLVGRGTGKMGVTPVNQVMARDIMENLSSPYMFQDELSPNVQAFAVQPLDQRYLGMRPEQDTFFIQPNSRGNEPYLYGHEMTHSGHLTPGGGIGNQGYMPTRNPLFQDESTPGGRENWLVENYIKRNVPIEQVGQERLASQRGVLRSNQDSSMSYNPQSIRERLLQKTSKAKK